MAAMMIRRFDPAADAALLLMVAVVRGGASIGFMADASQAQALAWWQGRAGAAANGEWQILLALDDDGQIIGTASLVPAAMPNQPHRADVAKMMVHPAARRRGVARQLLASIEAEARAQGRTTLVLDTVTGSDAFHLYASAGWQHVGDIADYALMPDGTMASTSVFTRRL